MTHTDAQLEERFRSAATVTPFDEAGLDDAARQKFREAQQHAREMLRKLEEHFEGSGAVVNSLSATVTGHETTFKTELRMRAQAAARLMERPRKDWPDFFKTAWGGRAQELRGLERGQRLVLGGRVYPLVRPLSNSLFAGVAGSEADFGPAATDAAERFFHFQFQRLRHTPPHEWNEHDERLWSLLLKHVDIATYEAANRRAEHRVGRLVSCDLDGVVIEWFGIGQGSYDIRSVPADLIGVEPGATVHADLKALPGGRISWVSLRTSPPLREDEEVLRDDADEIAAHSLDHAPEGVWPRRGH